MASLFQKYSEAARERKRLRDLGIQIGHYKTGPFNGITDVAGVKVGHATLIEGSGRRKPGKGPIRTGVTMIIPSEDTFERKLVASGFILNGAGEVAGLTQLMEWGLIETPIALTNTLSVGRVGDSIVKWMAQRYGQNRIQQEVVIPVVGECDDSFLNDAIGLHIRPQDVFAAIDSASSGPVLEGCVGAGTGMICCDFKGGIGTSSRVIPMGAQKEEHTIGVLVLSNFGRMEDLRVDGYPVGRVLSKVQGEYTRRRFNYGSIITVVATDLPVTPLQLGRICKRAALGIGRVGTYAAHGSGEIIIGFSTANTIPSIETPKFTMTVINDPFLDPAYEAVIEATEEAILNSLTAAVDTDGVGGRRVPAVDIDMLRNLFSHYNSTNDYSTLPGNFAPRPPRPPEPDPMDC